MKYLDEEKIQQIIDNKNEFDSKPVFSWVNASILTDVGYNNLTNSLIDLDQVAVQKPQIVSDDNDLSKFNNFKYYTTNNKLNPVLPTVWEEFIDELSSDVYKDFIGELLDIDDYELRFEWNVYKNFLAYNPSPGNKIRFGAQYFNFNKTEDSDKWKIKHIIGL